MSCLSVPTCPLLFSSLSLHVFPTVRSTGAWSCGAVRLLRVVGFYGYLLTVLWGVHRGYLTLSFGVSCRVGSLLSTGVVLLSSLPSSSPSSRPRPRSVCPLRAVCLSSLYVRACACVRCCRVRFGPGKIDAVGCLRLCAEKKNKEAVGKGDREAPCASLTRVGTRVRSIRWGGVIGYGCLRSFFLLSFVPTRFLLLPTATCVGSGSSVPFLRFAFAFVLFVVARVLRSSVVLPVVCGCVRFG